MFRFFAITMIASGMLACTPQPPAPSPAPALEPTATGLRVLPDGREIGYGRDWTNVRATMSAIFGQDGVLACDGTALRWGPWVLRQDDGRFVGLGCAR